MEDVKKRRIELDIARTIAIICVVLCHASEAIYKPNSNMWGTLSDQSKLFFIIVFTIGRIGVPIFIFLTGTLILNKKFQKDEDVYKFYKHNLLPLIIVNSIWIIIYNVFFWINNHKDYVTVEFIIKELLLLKQVPLSHMWYLPMIIGLYIGLPFISIMVKAFSKKTLLLFIAIIFTCSFVLPMINTFIQILGIKDSYNSLLNISFFGGIYGIYAIVGYFIDDYKKKNHILTISMAILCYIVTCAIQIFSYIKISKSTTTYYVWYNFPFLLICSSCVFKLILNIDTSKINKKLVNVITFISKTSLGIFFIHIITQEILTPYIQNINIIMPFKILFLFVFNFILCLIVNLLICKFKNISKYAILVKN